MAGWGKRRQAPKYDQRCGPPRWGCPRGFGRALRRQDRGASPACFQAPLGLLSRAHRSVWSSNPAPKRYLN